MWRDENGVTHTVALADPRALMTADIIESLAALSAAARRRLAHELAEYLDGLFDGLDPEVADVVGGVQGELPPDEILSGRFTDTPGLLERVEAIDPRWRIDVALAVCDVIDEWDVRRRWWIRLTGRLRRHWR